MKNTTTTTTATTTKEYRNRYGLTAFQHGEKVDISQIGKMYLTAVNCAISATRIKRDLTQNPAIALYLDDIDSALKYAWNNIDDSGNIHCFDSNRKEDVEDAIADCVVALYEYDEEVYSKEIAKRVRNCCDKRFNDVARPADSILAESLEVIVENKRENEITAPVVAVGFRNKSLLQAIKNCGFDEVTLYILDEIASGRAQTAIANDLHISNVAVHKRYKKAVAMLQDALDSDNVKEVVNGHIYR